MIKLIRFFRTTFELERGRIVIQTILEGESEVTQKMILLRLNEKSNMIDENEKSQRNRDKRL